MVEKRLREGDEEEEEQQQQDEEEEEKEEEEEGASGCENSSVENSDSGDSVKNGEESRSLNKQKSVGSIEKKQFANAVCAYTSNHHMYQGAMGA